MMSGANVLILDEPINGLDPQGIAEVRNLLHRLCTERHISILISSHILDELSKVSNRYGIIHNGKLLAEATNEQLMAQCKPHIFLRTNDPEKTKKVLSEMGISDYSFNGDHFEIRERVDQGGQISMVLAKSDIQTLEIRSEGQSLEEFYFQLTGGNPNV